ncbi:MAG: CHAT domain-containing protein [bacterium]|nr:CHAT domain-containing protein [bacterium]
MIGSSMMNAPAICNELEIGLHKIDAAAYQVELRFTRPDSEAELPPERGTVAFDLDPQLDPHLDAEAYGAALTASLFPPENRGVLNLYGKARVATEASGLPLRVRLFVGPTAAELQTLRWELLCDPENGKRLATSERILLSRFMVSSDWRPVRLRPKTALRALVAVAAPSDAARLDLAEVDASGEAARARAALQGIHVDVVGVGEPLTLERLVDRLRNGIDVLYLICHGAVRRESFVCLQKEDGTADVVRGAELAERIAELRQTPRLAVLASCQSAGSRTDMNITSESTVQLSLAPRLAEAGVAAILAMQGNITVPTLEKAMPVFFRELVKDGQIDRALAVARGIVRHRLDAWIPVLYLRLKRGRIWYVPGFTGTDDEFSKWKSIVGSVRRQRFVPVLGPDACEHLFGSIRELAHSLARDHDFPLVPHQTHDLAKVAQFLSVDESPTEARDALVRQLHREILKRNPDLDADTRQLGLGKLLDAVVKQRGDDNDPMRILTDLAAPLYVNASPDPVLFKTLKDAGRTPTLLVSNWRRTPENHPAEPLCEHDPSRERPVVYQPFGIFGKWDSVVLTEDDFLDYLIAASTYRLMPRVVRSTLVESSLLFLGFPLDDWAFRVLFRMIMTLNSTARLESNAHVGVQVDPEEYGPADVERTRRYLARYFSAAPRIEIYWGRVADFLEDLRLHLESTPADVPVTVEEDEDVWL